MITTDNTEQPIFRGYGELDEADLNKCYSLEDLEHSMKGYSPKPKQDASRYEKMATWALDAFFTRKKRVVVDKEVPGLGRLHPSKIHLTKELIGQSMMA